MARVQGYMLPRQLDKIKTLGHGRDYEPWWIHQSGELRNNNNRGTVSWYTVAWPNATEIVKTAMAQTHNCSKHTCSRDFDMWFCRWCCVKHWCLARVSMGHGKSLCYQLPLFLIFLGVASYYKFQDQLADTCVCTMTTCSNMQRASLTFPRDQHQSVQSDISAGNACLVSPNFKFDQLHGNLHTTTWYILFYHGLWPKQWSSFMWISKHLWLHNAGTYGMWCWWHVVCVCPTPPQSGVQV